MPWFFFKSGVVFKARPVREAIRSDLLRLIVPMVIWTVIGYLIEVPKLLIYDSAPLLKIILWPAYSFVMHGDTRGNDPLWFLFSLFVVKVVMLFISQRTNAVIFALVIFMSVLSYFFHAFDLMLPFGLSTVPLGLFFTTVGYVYGKINLRIQNYLAVIMFVVALSVACLYPSYVDVHLNRLWYGNYFSYQLISILCILVLLSLLNLLNGARFHGLMWVGNRSMYFLVSHWPVFTLVMYFFKLSGLQTSGWGYFTALSVTSIAISVLIARFASEKIMGLDGRLLLKPRASET